MRRAWPVALAGILTGTALFGVLSALHPRNLEREDPWLYAWQHAGIRAQFKSHASKPASDYLVTHERARLARPEFERCKLRNYELLGGVRAQVLELPSAHLCLCGGVDEDLCIEGARITGDRRTRRVGRFVLALQSRIKMSPLPSVPLPTEMVEKIEDAFVRTAEGRR